MKSGKSKRIPFDLKMLEGERRDPGGRNPIRTQSDSSSFICPEKKGRGYSYPVTSKPTPVISKEASTNWSDLL